MKRLTYLIILILFPLIAQSQIAKDFIRKGMVQDSIKDFRGAILYYTLAIEKDPNYIVAYLNRGNSKVELGDHEGAITDFTKAIDLDPKYPGAYFNRANSERAFKNYMGAIVDYTKTIELDPNFVELIILEGLSRAILLTSKDPLLILIK